MAALDSADSKMRYCGRVYGHSLFRDKEPFPKFTCVWVWVAENYRSDGLLLFDELGPADMATRSVFL